VELLPRIEAAWKIGRKQLIIPTLGYTKRINVFVTLLWPSRKIVWNVFRRRRNGEFRRHLSHVLAHARRHKLKKIIMFVDHASYHKTKEVKKFRREHRDMLRIKFLGKKDPNSNPTECLVNKRLNSAVSINRCHASIDELTHATREFLGRYNNIYAT